MERFVVQLYGFLSLFLWVSLNEAYQLFELSAQLSEANGMYFISVEHLQPVMSNVKNIAWNYKVISKNPDTVHASPTQR